MAAIELHEGAISPRTAWSRVVIKENLLVLLARIGCDASKGYVQGVAGCFYAVLSWLVFLTRNYFCALDTRSWPSNDAS
jgi:hypothetical protein